MRTGGAILNLDTAPKYLNASLKVGWAKHHLRTLDVEIANYMADEPYTISTKDDIEAGQHIVQLDTKPLTVAMGLIVGDFACCLRSSLDHLATWLTRVPGGTRNDRASFPIIGVDNADGRKSFSTAVKGVTPDAIKVIESFQPYHSGKAYKATKLWRLHRLWNIDKHRRIPLHAQITQINIGFPSDMSPVESWSDNSGIVRFPLAVKGNIHVNPAVKIIIQFGDQSEGIIIPHPELEEMYKFVRNDVMPRFKSFF